MQPALLRALRDLGFTEPTPVQAAAIPPALLGRDILASAQTGSGKSAAFGLPLLQALAGQPRGKTRALILAPTRELALQITAHLSALAKYSGVRVGAVYGGAGFGAQIKLFSSGTDIIVATPGRLLDHLVRKTAKLGDVSILVLDEADRMLDMGFLPPVRRIITYLPAQRQTLFFSATIPTAIAKLTQELLRDPVRVSLSPTGSKTTPVASVTQTVYSIHRDSKTNLLLELLKDNTIYSAIAFTRTKARANRLAAALAKNDIPSERIHGDRSQSQRVAALDGFKRGKFRVLVATDIAARGIDVVDLGHVINYDVPAVPEDYVHRIGRTARANKPGDAITFVSADEEGLFSQIERSLGGRLNRAKTPVVAQSAPSPAPGRPELRLGGRNTRRRPERRALSLGVE
ncbi:MAG: DEAD/DEAH box helicase [Vulcanimicrobiaceae bacterium]